MKSFISSTFFKFVALELQVLFDNSYPSKLSYLICFSIYSRVFFPPNILILSRHLAGVL